MSNPKTIRGFLLQLLRVANTAPTYLKGAETMNGDEELALCELVGAIQNRLGDELADLLERYKLEWKG